MRVLNIFFLILFLLSAGLQYNDPDPYLWVPIYLYGAFICFRAFQRRFSPALYITGWLAYIPYALYLFFSNDGVLSWWKEHNAENIAQSMKATRPWIEATREFFGLIILIAVLAANWRWFTRRKGRVAEPESQSVQPLHNR